MNEFEYTLTNLENVQAEVYRADQDVARAEAELERVQAIAEAKHALEHAIILNLSDEDMDKMNAAIREIHLGNN